MIRCVYMHMYMYIYTLKGFDGVDHLSDFQLSKFTVRAGIGKDCLPNL